MIRKIILLVLIFSFFVLLAKNESTLDFFNNDKVIYSLDFYFGNHMINEPAELLLVLETLIGRFKIDYDIEDSFLEIEIVSAPDKYYYMVYLWDKSHQCSHLAGFLRIRKNDYKILLNECYPYVEPKKNVNIDSLKVLDIEIDKTKTDFYYIHHHHPLIIRYNHFSKLVKIIDDFLQKQKILPSDLNVTISNEEKKIVMLFHNYPYVMFYKNVLGKIEYNKESQNYDIEIYKK